MGREKCNRKTEASRKKEKDTMEAPIRMGLLEAVPIVTHRDIQIHGREATHMMCMIIMIQTNSPRNGPMNLGTEVMKMDMMMLTITGKRWIRINYVRRR